MSAEPDAACRRSSQNSQRCCSVWYRSRTSTTKIFASRSWQILQNIVNPLRACLKNSLLVAQATRLCRPATRRTEPERQFAPMGTGFSQRCSLQFRSAGRRPGRAGRPRHPFSKQALKLRRDSDTRLKPGANESRRCENRRFQSRRSCPSRPEMRRAISAIRSSGFFRISDVGLRFFNHA